MADDIGTRSTSIVFLELESGPCFVLASLSSRSDTQVITVDQTSGSLKYSFENQFDCFESEADALEAVQGASQWSVKRIVYAKAILGYAVFGNIGLLLVAIKTRASIATLPTGDCVYTVVESRWLRISLACSQFLTREEEKNLTELLDIPIDELYYFCETRDITRPFPSSASSLDPDSEFVWNMWLSAPFRKIGLPHHCVVLLQGIADSRKFTDAKGKLATMALTARRSRFHPGTRYLARGLNAAYSTGNEVECEQLVWLCGIPFGRALRYSTYVWRRGTVPIWWKAEIKSAISDADIHVSTTEPYKGAVHYYRRLVKRYGPKTPNAETSVQNSSIPIFCINLLQGVIGKPEWSLSWHFQQSVNLINACREIPEAKLCVLNFDWHTKIGLLGDTMTVTALWQLLKGPTSEIGIHIGEIQTLNTQPRRDADAVQNKDLMVRKIETRSHQNGVFRFSCGDSLDRTNSATFFAAIQALGEQCRRLGISLEASRVSENCEYWGLYDLTFEEFKRVTLPRPISLLADLFILAGDIHATLYTGSRAMHSEIIQCLGKNASAHKKSSAARNLVISLQRRFTNIVLDAVRQRQIEMLLGLRRTEHFPSIPMSILNNPPISRQSRNNS
ncbi:hypothetical protein O6H91_12G043500 [Diphasiastrum complanatum]|uniref:Uncharacterized protein n=1 Tax=Diphasiastrum complanatum TaxID=34168 RepID=A0ACC2C1A2_DIPCM|nr:hypothetical protein O6H91_12G043500 [Diphasiastrum complanatum]